MIPSVTIKCGDCRTVLKTLEAQSVQCCVTSPPYFGLRDYGHAEQIGLESTPDDYVETMRQVFAEVWRVLRDDATLWLNLGDSYAGGGNYRGINSENTLSEKQNSNRGARGLSQQLGAAGKETGLSPKNLIGIPWRVAFALQSDGWYLRSDIIWHKPNPMPESMIDRPTRSHEYIFLFSKSERYYYDHEAIKEPSLEFDWESRLDRPSDKSFPTGERNGIRKRAGGGFSRDYDENRISHGAITSLDRPDTGGLRNKRDVWTVTTSPYPDAHFATFPPDLIKPCILAGTKPGETVLDPFFGSGTTGMVSLELGRNCIGIELNPDYVALAKQRCNTTPGFALA